MANLSFVFSGSPCSQAGGIPLLPVLSSVTYDHPRSLHSSPGRCDYRAEGGDDQLLVSAPKPRPPRPESTVGSPALPCGERRPGRVNTRPAPLSRERFFAWFVDLPTGRLSYPRPELRPALAHVGCSSGGRAGLQGSGPPRRSPEL